VTAINATLRLNNALVPQVSLPYLLDVAQSVELVGVKGSIVYMPSLRTVGRDLVNGLLLLLYFSVAAHSFLPPTSYCFLDANSFQKHTPAFQRTHNTRHTF
jgi:hypothetical protein